MNVLSPLSNRFYFDHNATTPISPEVLRLHVQALEELFGNASSIHHFGQAARKALEHARRDVAALLGAESPKHIVFLSGGTEADNTVIFGAVAGRHRTHVITSAIEHPAVLNACAELERRGHTVTYVPVGSTGVVDPDDVRRALRPETALITVMHVNNEIGTVQPVAEFARVGREAGVPVHSDGVQAAGRVPVDVAALGVDAYSVSGHKMYAPKGVGALYVKPGFALAPLIFGGRHEHGRRAGTENVPGAVAMGAAAASLDNHIHAEAERVGALRDRLERGLLDRIPNARVNGASAPRAANTTNVCFEGIEGEAVVIALDLAGFCVSSGSACSSGAVEPSHVLTAIGLTRSQAKSSVRFSLGRSNTVEQVDALIDATATAVERLRRISTDYIVHA